METIAPRVKLSLHGVESRQALDMAMVAKVMALGVILIVGDKVKAKVEVKGRQDTETFVHGQILRTAIGAIVRGAPIKVKDRFTREMDRPGNIKMVKGHRDHIKTNEAHQGYIVSGMIKVKGHGTPPGMWRQYLLTWPMGLSKGPMTRDLIPLELLLHLRHGKEGVARCVEHQVVIRTSTQAYLGTRTEVVTCAEREDAIHSSIEMKNGDFRAMARLNRHVVRKTVRGDRERATGPRRRTRAARRLSPLQRRRD